MAKRTVRYYKDRLQGSMSEANCDNLEYILKLKEVNGSIDSLKHTIYLLSDEEVARIQREKTVDPSISKEKGTLADNQTLGLAYMFYSGNCIIGDSVGLGKTVQVSALINLMRKQNHDRGLPFRYLFLTEKTLVEQAVKELTKFTRQYVHELTGEKKENVKWREEMWDGHKGGIVAPHSLIKQQVFHSWLDDMLDGHELANGNYYLDYIFIDESSFLGSTTTQIYKYAEQLRKYAKHVILMNATPFESNLDTFYGQLNFLDENLMPAKTTFKKIYYVLDYGRKKWGEHNGKYKNASVFRHQVGYFYFYQTRKQLGAEMKNTNYEIVTRDMTREQDALMKLTDMYGYVYDCPTYLDPDIPFDEENVPKLDMLEELLENKIKVGEQVLIFCHYKEAQRRLKDWFENRGYDTEILNGDITNREERNGIVGAFKNKEYEVLITSVQKGLNFGDVPHLIFYSFSTNPNKMIQMEGRITRSFHIENKNFYLLAHEGRELNKLKKDVSKTLESSREFSSDDLSAVVEMLLNLMD
ncbi:helicase-related protein [Bacillus cereus]|uniref:helicase-related protein n=1 Tax=Bacillus cereus TaxID=1396 RepID=UPI003D167303